MPINMLLVSLFSRTSPRPSTRQYPTFILDESAVFKKKRGSKASRGSASGVYSSVSHVEGSTMEHSEVSDSDVSVSNVDSSVVLRQNDDKGGDVDGGGVRKQSHADKQGHAKKQSHSEKQGHVQKQGHGEKQGQVETQGPVEKRGHTEKQGQVKTQDQSTKKPLPQNEECSSSSSTSDLNLNVSAHTDEDERQRHHHGLISTSISDLPDEHRDTGGSYESDPLTGSLSTGIQLWDTTAYPWSDQSFRQDARQTELFTDDPLDTNNSANKSDCDSYPRQPSSEKPPKLHPSTLPTERFSFIKETLWFQNAVTYLRNNVNRLMEESRKREERNKESRARSISAGEGWSEPREGSSSHRHGSYFDKLRARKQGQPRPQEKRKRKHGSTKPSAHPTAGVERQSEIERETSSYQDRSYSEKLKAQNRDQPRPQDRKQNQEKTETSAHPHAGGERRLEIRRGASSHRGRSYFDKLKAKTQDRGLPQADWTVSCYSHPGSGDQALPLHGDGHLNALRSDTMRDRRRCASQPRVDGVFTEQPDGILFSHQTKRRSETPVPQTCWFCRTVPGHEQTMRHLQALTVQRDRSKVTDRPPSVTDKPSIVETFKRKLSRSRRKAGNQSQDDFPREEAEEEVPFDVIRRQHDYEYERAGQKGAKALKMFKRRAAQCIAEDFLNSNTNADSEPKIHNSPTTGRKSSDGKTGPAKNKSTAHRGRTSSTAKASSEVQKQENDSSAEASQVKIDMDDEEDSEDEAVPVTGGCRACLKATYDGVWATVMCVFFCQCPRG